MLLKTQLLHVRCPKSAPDVCLMDTLRQHTQEYVEAAAPSFVVGEFWSTCVYDDQGHLVYNQVSAGRQQCSRCMHSRPQPSGFPTLKSDAGPFVCRTPTDSKQSIGAMPPRAQLQPSISPRRYQSGAMPTSAWGPHCCHHGKLQAAVRTQMLCHMSRALLGFLRMMWSMP